MSALDKSTRRKIFYGMVLLFAVVAPVALLYSRGYVFDRERRGLVVTGGIFVKTVQSGARVFVDSEFSKETSFISHGALITNLIPRRYTVRVEKEGYQPWIKAVRVANEEVLEFRNVLLPPAAISSQPFFSRSGGMRVFWLDGRRALALGRRGVAALRVRAHCRRATEEDARSHSLALGNVGFPIRTSLINSCGTECAASCSLNPRMHRFRLRQSYRRNSRFEVGPFA